MLMGVFQNYVHLFSLTFKTAIVMFALMLLFSLEIIMALLHSEKCTRVGSTDFNLAFSLGRTRELRIFLNYSAKQQIGATK